MKPESIYGTSRIREEEKINPTILGSGYTVYKKHEQKNTPVEPTYPVSIRINDNRKVRATTGQPINPNRDLKSGYYTAENIHAIIKEAKERDYPPYRALAVDMVETGLGRADDQTGHVLDYSKRTPQIDEYIKKYGDEYTGTRHFKAGAMIDVLQDKAARARQLGYTSDEHQLQLYNGTKLRGNTESDYHARTGRAPVQKAWYGVPIPPEGYIDLLKNPLYGKEVMDIENMLKSNSDIKTMVDTVGRIPYVYKK